jgi:hypothetical protein
MICSTERSSWTADLGTLARTFALSNFCEAKSESKTLRTSYEKERTYAQHLGNGGNQTRKVRPRHRSEGMRVRERHQFGNSLGRLEKNEPTT